MKLFEAYFCRTGFLADEAEHVMQEARRKSVLMLSEHLFYGNSAAARGGHGN